MISNRDVVLISSIEWSFLWQHPQEIAVRLARAGNRVLYVENTGVRSPGIRDADRVLRRLRRWGRSLRSRGVRQVADNIYVCSPLVLPPFGGGLRRQVNRRLLLPLVRRAARGLGMRDVILWTHLPTDTALDLIRLLRTPRGAVVYYCIADFLQLTPHKSELRETEREIIQLSDVVFTNSLQLTSHCRRWNENVHLIPPGVNMEDFPPEEPLAQSRPAGGGGGEALTPSDREYLSSLPRPVIGYVGGLHRYVDFDLLDALARARPQWSWVFVGPAQAPVRKISELPNVHLLGERPHQKLVHFIRSFDVCIVPYVNNRETATVSPVKINEYLAVGKAVVSTDLPAVCEFNERHGVLFTSSGEPGGFLGAIEMALGESQSPAAVARRRRVAGLNDWSLKLEEMLRLVESAREDKGAVEVNAARA